MHNADIHSAQETHLQGFSLILARVAWVAIVVPALALFVANVPAYFASLHQLTSPHFLYTGQLTLDDVGRLQALGLSLDFYAVCMLVVSLIFQFSYTTVGALLFWRKSDTPIALLASFSLMMLPFAYANLTLQALPPVWAWLIPTLITLGNASIMLCAYVFPDGKFVPYWIRWLALAMLAYWAFLFWALDGGLFDFILLLGFALSTVTVQAYRYRYVSNGQQRQQTRWVVFGIAIAVTGNIGTRLITAFILSPFFPESSLPFALQVILVSLSMLAIPPTLAIAILRSRLWDIDVIINRTLVYGALSGALALIYFGSVIGLQFVLHGLTEGNQLALVISTLAIAALFQPLRRRIQDGIDRRFYRRKYDAARVLNAFSATLRNEVDLNTLTEQLVGMVEETMEPTHVSLWLRGTESSNKRKTRLLPGLDEESTESNWERYK